MTKPTSEVDTPGVKIRRLISLRLIEALSAPETATPGILQAAIRFYEMTKSSEDEPLSKKEIEDFLGEVPFPVKRNIKDAVKQISAKESTNG